MKHFDWRGILARLPLPMLALAASYGVYSFALLFVPPIVAGIQAAAFELTYIGLAVTRDLDTPQRKRATGISLGAVATSIIYNTLAGWFHSQAALLETASPIAWLCLAVLHGAPLAWVAYLVADLLLHSQINEEKGHSGVVPNTPPTVSLPAIADAKTPAETTVREVARLVTTKTTKAYTCPACKHPLSLGQYGSASRYGHCRNCKRVSPSDD